MSGTEEEEEELLDSQEIPESVSDFFDEEEQEGGEQGQEEGGEQEEFLDSQVLSPDFLDDSDSDGDGPFLISSGSNFDPEDYDNWLEGDDVSIEDDDDYFMNELSLPNSSQETMDNENDGDGGYDDDTDVDDEVVILEPGEQGPEGGFQDDSNEEDENNEDQETEDEGEGEANRATSSPPRKVARMDPNPDPIPESTTSGNAAQSTDEGDSDGLLCTICYDQFTNSGEHRISCLKCGHVFGQNCILKWLKIHGRCPQCNCKAKKGEVRVLYVKSLQALDNTELTQAKKELEAAQVTIAKYTLETAKKTITIDALSQQLKAIEQQNLQLKQQQRSSSSRVVPTMSVSNPGPSSSSNPRPSSSSSAAGSSSLACTQITVPSMGHDQSTGRKQLRFAYAKFCEIKEGACRIGAYNEWMNLMVVSHDMKNSLFPNGCCGIKQVNMLDLRPTLSMPLHQKQIRDMQFSLCQNDVLLTVSMDKKAILYNCGGNVTIQTFQAEYPMWSCVWDEVQQHIFYVGCANGSIIVYDIRSPQDALATYLQGSDKSPVCRLRYVSPAYQNNAFNLSGLLVQKLNSVAFMEFRGGSNSDVRFHPLSLEGPFFNVDFENGSRHMLVSTRPSPRNDVNHGCHYLSDLSQYYSETLERNVVTSNVVQVYQGSYRDGQKISRPSLFSPGEGYVYVLANGAQNTVKYWDISLSDSNNKSISNAPDYVLDYVHGRVNSNNFLGLISEKGVRIFNQTFN